MPWVFREGGVFVKPCFYKESRSEFWGARCRAPLPQSTLLEVTTTQLSLDGTKPFDLDSLQAQRERGMKPEWKERGPNDFAVVPLIETLKTAHRRRPRDSELAVKLAPDVPYRTLIEALFSSSEAGYGFYRLSTSSPALELLARKPAEDKGAHVTVFILRDGIKVKATVGEDAGGANMMGDCTQRGPGLAVTSNTDFAALGRACGRCERRTPPCPSRSSHQAPRFLRGRRSW